MYIPWGFVAVEQTENSRDCYGIRWMLCGKTCTPGFETLTLYAVPPGDEVINGSTGDLLKDIHQALIGIHGEAAIPEAANALANNNAVTVKREVDKRQKV